MSKYLDKISITTLVNKIKTYIDKFLPLTGGTITGYVNFNGNFLQ